MSARDPSNLRRWVGWGVKKAGMQGYRRKIRVDAENCRLSGDTIANGQRKGVPNSWSGNSEAICG